jgi:hypothetical protein
MQYTDKIYELETRQSGADEFPLLWESEINPEYIKLAQTAYDTVLATMLDGEATHPAQEWQTVSVKDHVQHITDHVDDFRVELVRNRKVGTDDHIGHALTRLAMIKALQK